MPYHSSHNKDDVRLVSQLPILPFNTAVKGPAPQYKGEQGKDIIDETIEYYRANVLFKQFDVEGPADKLMIYLTLFITQCLQKVEKQPAKSDGQRLLIQLAQGQFDLPGAPKFPLGGLVNTPEVNETDLIRNYLRQAREEIVVRLVDRIYPDGKLSKWWAQFAKKKFLNKTM
ncbi:putative ARP2/3 complex 21 kDa subunit [Blattamonas nauphoetae]|uniref:Actin-related protein 2/3 complex subunit 3 n=1 Tax=Blattamonas nauphoetae TaxID=2049346 RepID=A0ABQ9Y9E5_9EUKA|nr:putative ARP2/3 complex 21 kDa subunit [Blattamonas nauphoetae]